MNWTKFKKEYFRGFYSYWTYCANWLVGLRDIQNWIWSLVDVPSQKCYSSSAVHHESRECYICFVKQEIGTFKTTKNYELTCKFKSGEYLNQ